MQVLLHGGAGGSPDDPDRHRRVLDGAAAEARRADTPREAVMTGVRRLESAPAFNAGVGSVVQSDGRIRTDAGLMTSAGDCGAACAMPGVAHAVDVAAAVASETPHVLLAGEGALALADSVGVDTDRDLWTDASRERWRAADPPPADADPVAHRAWVRQHFGGSDTVGAVATDGNRLAAATSTGGRWFALPGRVGDVPQIGAGFYATPAAAASATGAGEAIARFGLARKAVELVADGHTPAGAASETVEAFEETGETAGVIVAGAIGGTGAARNAEAMPTASSVE